MSCNHKLKTWPEFFQQVWDGSKCFELRRADRDYTVGDMLLLREWRPGKPVGCRTGCPLRHVHEWAEMPGYTGRELTALVTYIFEGGKMGLEEGYVILSISMKQRSVTSSRFPAVKA